MSLLKRKPNVDPEAEKLTQELRLLDAILAHYPQGTRLRFGSPCRCPKCGEFGFTVNTNHQGGIASYSCLNCRTDWVVTRRSLDTYDERRTIEEPAADEFDTADYLNGSKPPLQVLLVEDDPADAALLEAILRPLTPAAVQIAKVTNRADAEKAFQLGFDVVVLDLNLPDSAGLSTLRAFRDACPDAVVCVCSGIPSLGPNWNELAQQSLPKQEFTRLAAEGRSGANELFGFLQRTMTTPLASKA